MCPRGRKPCPWSRTRQCIPLDAGWECCGLQLFFLAGSIPNWPPMRRAGLLHPGVFDSPSLRWNHVSHVLALTVLLATPQQSVLCFSSEFQGLSLPLESLVMTPGAADQGWFSFLSVGLLSGAVGGKSGSAALLLCAGADVEGRACRKSLSKSNWGLRGLLPVKLLWHLSRFLTSPGFTLVSTLQDAVDEHWIVTVWAVGYSCCFLSQSTPSDPCPAAAAASYGSLSCC